MWERLCAWVKCNRFIQAIFWHEDLGSFNKNLAASAGSKRWVFYWMSFTLGHSLGVLLLIKQFFPGFGVVVSDIHVQAYLIVAGIYAFISQLDVWFTSGERKFFKGEYIFFFWLLVSCVSFLVHFATGGQYPAPEELLEIWTWIGGFFATSALSAYLKLHQNTNGSKNGHQGKPDDDTHTFS